MAVPRLQVPAADGAVLAVPPLTEVGRLLAGNGRQLAAAPVAILGRPLSELRALARRETIAAAAEYMRAAGEPVPATGPHPLLLAGHQPELFHPGVWCKNFALNGLARHHGLLPLNLVVDNDTAKSTTLRLPHLQDGSAHLDALPFDWWAREVPYEERHVHDEELFASLPERVEPITRAWPFRPLLADYWAEVRRQGQRTPLLGERCAAARRTLERRWGCQNLELPVSALARTEAFGWYAMQMLGDIERFHAIYNTAVHEHRRQHQIHSKNHPVPDLARRGDWLETPLWAWRSGQGERQRLFARVRGDQIELNAGTETWPALPRPEPNPPAAVAAYQQLAAQGYKVRPRALSMTLFARLFVAELFIHGIGGGKYDELTDAILHRAYGMPPPAFLVLSATLRLPLPVHAVAVQDRRRLARQLRDLQWNPHRQLDLEDLPDRELAQVLTARETASRERPADPAARRQRFERIRGLSERLRPLLAASRQQTAQRLALVEQQLAANAVTQRRDFAFCLFPEDRLRGRFAAFLRGD